ncbi:hypothetical protein K505DRAFT_234237 [Melanomma pulvis-pyrius CBS 109.77]|uniref:Secreted protein n=1 Tax=Melanomma pulvis-pyrius CBS 109.77 TaxID=1314802 RepID=A0A6A6XR38_9PLEO|nr:hypothetical protein K505DRAFT_234237 [Melanomma pulvis-pyrius CBS 109.77]
MILSNFIFVCSLVCSVASATPIAAAVNPPKGTCTISAVDVDVDTDGNGCRPGSVAVAISEDNSLINLLFDNFQAAIGPNAGAVSKRALCKVNITMSSPGWTFDVNTVDFRGYIKLAGGVDISLVSRWKWIDSKGVDMKGKGNMQKQLSGPFENDVLLHKDGEVSDTVSSACSKTAARFQLTISASLSATVSSGSGVLKGTQDGALDRGFSEILNLGWRKC